MPRLKPFDKKTSTTYALVHRPQNDPLIHDPDAPQQIFTEISGPSSGSQPHGARNPKISHRGELESEFTGALRANEGEAAEHGVFFDDSRYDYMQHLRELGGGEGTFIESGAKKEKGKQRLEDALSSLALEGARDEGLEDTAARARYKRTTYQDQQDVPDALRGFQPDMDPRLREVLEALEDEEYVDDSEDIFAELAGDGEELEQDEWEAQLHDEDDGWESDTTTKPTQEYSLPTDESTTNPIPESTTDGDWLASFAKNKPAHPTTAKPTPSTALDSHASLFAGKHKKRKGALTSSSAFSMTSSALARTEPLSTLDERFDRIAESYMEDADDDQSSVVSGMTGMTGASRYSSFAGSQAGSQVSEAPSLVPAAFDAMLDDFLTGRGSQKNRKAGRKGGSSKWSGQSGISQLDEVRSGLGPARVKN